MALDRGVGITKLGPWLDAWPPGVCVGLGCRNSIPPLVCTYMPTAEGLALSAGLSWDDDLGTVSALEADHSAVGFDLG